MLCLVIGTYCEGLGLVLRLAFRKNLHSSGIYIVQYLFVVLSVSIIRSLGCNGANMHSHAHS